jgi:hypothetical protein
MQRRCTLCALTGYKKALGPSHTSTLCTVNSLGLVYADQGKLKEAEEIYHRVLEGKEKVLGLDHLIHISTLSIVWLGTVAPLNYHLTRGCNCSSPGT